MSRFASNGLPDPSSADLLENELKSMHGQNPPFEYRDASVELMSCYALLS